jgi:malonate-semialdehyde dehydrogenase (acetylating)/methylmalonate-semialdehyde dehydrogenase
VSRAEKLKVGDGMEAGVGVGPVVSKQAQARIVGMIDQAVADGAMPVLDGRVTTASPDGAFVGPTILENVKPGSQAACEEIFGPVLSVIEVDSLDDAIALVNTSNYGNGTSIFTESGAAVRRYRAEAEIGMIGVNVGVAAPVAFFPFSGWKDSFLGDMHAHGTDAVDFFTKKKTITSRYFSAGPSGKFFVE